MVVMYFKRALKSWKYAKVCQGKYLIIHQCDVTEKLSRARPTLEVHLMPRVGSRHQASQVHLIGGCGHFVAAAALSEYRHVSVRIIRCKLNYFLGKRWLEAR